MFILQEIKGDLFDSDTAIAHCVSADLKMGKGIAEEFRDRFGGVRLLLSQFPRVGETLSLDTPNWPKPVYYLVTKKLYNDKPSYSTLQKALISLREKCERDDVTELSIPRLGCGLDKLDWKHVKENIREIFAASDIHITVYVQ